MCEKWYLLGTIVVKTYSSVIFNKLILLKVSLTVTSSISFLRLVDSKY